VPQGSVLGPVLYLLEIGDLPVALGSITTTYANDTAVLVAHNNRIEASLRLSLYRMRRRGASQRWLKKCKLKANGRKSVQMMFIRMVIENVMFIRRETYSSITLRIPQAEDAKYLGLHLDRRLNWKNIFTERKQFGLQLGKCIGYSVINHN